MRALFFDSAALAGRQQQVSAVEHVGIIGHAIGRVVVSDAKIPVGVTGHLNGQVPRSGDTVLGGRTGCRRNIGIPRAIDDDIRENHATPKRCRHDHAADFVPFHHRTAAEAAEPDFGIGPHQL